MLAKVTILLCHQLPFHPHSAMGFFSVFYKKINRNFFNFKNSNMWHGRFGERKKKLSKKQIIFPIQLQ
jgi:hypothetical protein